MFVVSAILNFFPSDVKNKSQNTQSLPTSVKYKTPKPSAPPQQQQQQQGNYDAPWDWKIKKVESDFDKRFSLQEQPPVAAPRKKSTPNVITHATVSNANPIPKPKRDPSIKIAEADKEYEVDPTIPLDNQG